MAFIYETHFKIWSKITGPWNVSLCDLNLLWGHSLHQAASLSQNIQSKITGPWNTCQCDLHLLWGQSLKHTNSYSQSMMFIQRAKSPNHEIKSLWPTFILRSKVGSHKLIIPKYDIHPSNSPQVVRQKSLVHEILIKLTCIKLMSKVMSHWLIIPKYDLHQSNKSSRYKTKSLDHEQ